jgi:light-regulated signal transduction histidine kinase (bacteriophytochrome)
MRLRVVCELFASTASLRLDAHVSAAEAASRIVAKQIIESLLLKLAAEPDFATALTRLRPNLFDLIHADGVTLRFGGQTTSVGHTPNDEQILSLAHWLNERDQGVFATDNLVALYPPAEAFAGLGSGLIAVSLSMIPEDYVMWFQPEMIQTVTWAGNPDKAEADAAPAARLTPRTSFAAWRESVRRRSRHWEAAEIEAATSLRMALLEIVLRRIDLLTREQAAARRQQDMLMAELDHRVKNMLATIQALIMQSRGSADTIGGFISTFEGRLYAMSRAHSLLTQGRWEGADLRALIMEEMAPYAGPENSIVVIEGHGTITLRPKAALAFSLGIHELATNAAKYGGLSKPGGRVHIAWHIETKDSKMVVLSWKESGGPPVAEPEKRGFGVTLIENSMAYELGGRVDLQFRSDGVACTIEVPWDQIAHAASPTPRPVTAQTACIGLPAGMRILIVEDNSLIARSTEQLLKAMGANILGPVSRLPIAMQIAESQQMDAALLDIDLDGTRVWPVAEILARRGVPFIFTTGYAAGLVMPPAFADRPVLTKPYDPDSLELLLTGIFQKRRRGDIETGQSPI